jgi:lipopolysaccharide transport system permease protein
LDTVDPAQPLYVVEPPRAWRIPDLQEVWRYRDLFLVLCWRELKLRYRQTALGVIWVILQPLLSSVLLAVIFSRLVGTRTAIPYVLIVFTGVVIWQFFGSAVQRASSSVVMDANLISKVYFPRMIVPLSGIGAALIDFLVSLVVLVVLLAAYRVMPSWRMLAFPAFVVLAAVAAIGVSLWMSALNVRYRDFMFAAPFLLQVWMYASPVVYLTSIVPERWRFLYEMNPAAGFIEGTRWSLLGTPFPERAVWISASVALLLLVTGAVVFRHIERELTDII